MATPSGTSANDTDRERISLPIRYNGKLQEIVEAVNENTELKTIWQMQNVTAVERLGYSDHGIVHMQIISNIALKLIRLLDKGDVKPTLLENFDGFDMEDAEVVVVLASLMHDAGMSIHRQDHEEFSLLIAQRLLDELLEPVYDEKERTILRSEILHAIISHRSGGNPLTYEAGIVRVADALDMEKGRSRLSFKVGKIDIHSVSAASVDKVVIDEGDERAINICITLNNSAGIYQVDELLRSKIDGSGLEDHITVEATVNGETEKQILESFKL